MRFGLFALAGFVVGIAPSGSAQGPRPSELDVTRFGVVLDHPDTRRVSVREDIPYLTTPAGRQDLDIYLPPDFRPGERRPAVVFLNAIGDNPGGSKVKRWEIYRSWPRLVAAHGLIGISMDADRDRVQESLRGVFRFLEQRGAEHGVDATRLGVYGASANVTGASIYLFGDSVSRGVRAAALYYGRVPPQTLRSDLAVLYIVPEGDVPGLGAALPALWQRVIDAKAPWRLLYGPGLPHAFDALTDTDGARQVLRETIGFWKSQLEPIPTRPDSIAEARAVVAATYWNQPARAVPALERWIAGHPDDANAWVQLGRMRGLAQQYDAADSAYRTAIRLGTPESDLSFALGQLRMGQQRWDEAAGYFTRLAGQGPPNSFVLGQLAYVEMKRGRYADAVAAYERAFAAGIPAQNQGVAYYNLACAHARLGHPDAAFENLSKAIDAGFRNRRVMEEDPDLESLRSDSRFGEMLRRLTG
jgi:tetratricopeptide (TPR) repeat protein